jgi:hypothetical protein
MQLAKFENGIESHTNVIARTISEKGVYVQHEGGYSYTVGLNEASLPEIVIKNDQSLSKSKIEDLVLGLRRCVSLTELNEALNSLGLECKSLSELDKRRCFYSARLYYETWEFFAVGLKVGESSEQ